MVVVQCQCGKTLTPPAGNHARKGVCPHCGRTLQLPVERAPIAHEPRLLAELRGHRRVVLCSIFSPDGRLLATCGGSEPNDAEIPRFAEVRLWDVEKKRAAAAMQGHQDTVLCAAFTPDGETLITGSADHTLVVWNVSRGMHDVVMGLKEHTLKGHATPITSVAVSSDGARLYSASEDGEVRLWDTARWHCDRVLATGRSGACRLAQSADGRYLAAVWRNSGPVIIWSTKHLEEHLRLVLRADELSEQYDVAFSPDGAFLAVQSANQMRIWDLSSCQVGVAVDAAGYHSLAYAPNGRVLAAAGAELKTRFEVQLWESLNGEPLATLSGHHDALATVCFSPRGDRLACAGRSQFVYLWEV